MSSPCANLAIQKGRHRGPLIGKIVVVSFALAGLFFLMPNISDQGTPTHNLAGSIDGRNGLPATDAPTAPVPAGPPAHP